MIHKSATKIVKNSLKKENLRDNARGILPVPYPVHGMFWLGGWGGRRAGQGQGGSYPGPGWGNRVGQGGGTLARVPLPLLPAPGELTIKVKTLSPLVLRTREIKKPKTGLQLLLYNI